MKFGPTVWDRVGRQEQGPSNFDIASLRYVAGIVLLSRRIAWCETEMARPRLGLSEAFGVLHARLEGQRGDKANVRRGPKQLANRIVMRRHDGRGGDDCCFAAAYTSIIYGTEGSRRRPCSGPGRPGRACRSTDLVNYLNRGEAL